MIGSLGTRYRWRCRRGFSPPPGAWGILGTRRSVCLTCGLRKYGTYAGLTWVASGGLYVLHVLSWHPAPRRSQGAGHGANDSHRSRRGRKAGKNLKQHVFVRLTLRVFRVLGCGSRRPSSTAVPFAGACGRGYNAYFRSQIVPRRSSCTGTLPGEKCSLAAGPRSAWSALDTRIRGLPGPRGTRPQVRAPIRLAFAVGPIVAEDIENRWASDERFRKLRRNVPAGRTETAACATRAAVSRYPIAKGPRIQLHPVKVEGVAHFV